MSSMRGNVGGSMTCRRVNRQGRQQQTARATDDRETDALGDELANQPRASGPQR